MSVSLTEQFIKERQYLLAVTPKTIIWYGCGFKAFEGALESKEAVNRRIVELRTRNVQPITINSYLRVVNAYFNWLHTEHGKELVKIPKLKENQKILTTLSQTQINALLQWRPQGISVNLRRAHLVALTILDTGLRASEVLGVKFEDVNLDSLIIKVYGKGGKERLVPFCAELRKHLFRQIYRDKAGKGIYLFGTQNNTKVSVRNLERDITILGRKAGITGIRFSPHSLRHTFAVSYLRNGGNLEYLRKILGHSNISTTQKYLRSLGIEDLSNVHNSLSPLSQVHRSVR